MEFPFEFYELYTEFSIAFQSDISLLPLDYEYKKANNIHTFKLLTRECLKSNQEL